MYIPPFIPNFGSLYAWYTVTLIRPPGGGMEDILCGWAHGIVAANDDQA